VTHPAIQVCLFHAAVVMN